MPAIGTENVAVAAQSAEVPLVARLRSMILEHAPTVAVDGIPFREMSICDEFVLPRGDSPGVRKVFCSRARWLSR